jgi:D-3-phosphoglycerate dehydrogenase
MRIVVVDCNFESFREEQSVCERNGWTYEKHQCTTEGEIIDRCKGADALLVQYAPMTATVLAEMSGCRVLVRYGIGVDNVDLVAAREHSIAVCNVPDYGSDTVADHTAAMALCLNRQLPYLDNAIRGGEWPAGTPQPMLSPENMTFTVLGAGRIGLATLERVRPFGFRLAACDPYANPADLKALGIDSLSMEEAVEQSDVLSLHMPLTKDSYHLIDAQRMQAMKNSAILINTSRGGLVDTCALAAALEEGQIGFAGIDVFESEPMEADHPLRRCRNALLTPHLAYYSAASVVRLQRYASEEVERALKGDPLRCPVD